MFEQYETIESHLSQRDEEKRKRAEALRQQLPPQLQPSDKTASTVLVVPKARSRLAYFILALTAVPLVVIMYIWIAGLGKVAVPEKTQATDELPQGKAILFTTTTDADGDGLSSVQEQSSGTDAQAWDTDGDQYGDGEEVANGFDPLVAAENIARSDWQSIAHEHYVISLPVDWLYDISDDSATVVARDSSGAIRFTILADVGAQPDASARVYVALRKRFPEISWHEQSLYGRKLLINNLEVHVIRLANGQATLVDALTTQGVGVALFIEGAKQLGDYTNDRIVHSLEVD